MDIWFAANIPEGSYGGVARSMRELGSGLRQRGHSVTIHYGSAGALSAHYLVFAVRLGVRLLARSLKPPDWIIARSTDGVFCMLVARMLGLTTRVAIHNHGWEEHVWEIEKRLPRSLIASPTTWMAVFVRFPLLRLCLSLCNCCISGTVSEVRWLKMKYPRHKGKLRYAPNGTPVCRGTSWAERDHIPFHFLSVGNTTWKKNLAHTIGVFKKLVPVLPQARLFLVGCGADQEKALFAAAGLQKEIIPVPFEKPENIWHWYSTCPYLISSSRYEGGHSFAIIEALSYGCVVFSSGIPSSREIIRDRENGVLLTGVSVEEDAGIVLESLNNTERIASMRLKAKRTALRNRWERQVKRVEDILCQTR